MAIKTNDIQEFRNLGLENEFDFYDFGDLIESGTNFNYTGTVDPPGGAENSEYLVTLPIMFHKLTSKNFADEEELPEYRVEYYIELLDKMHDRLRSPEGNTLYDHMLKGIKAYEKDGHPGAVQKFYEGLHKADEVFGLGLHIEELDPDYEKAIENAKAEEVKLADEKKQQEAKKAADEAKKKTWENYDRRHLPKEGVRYSQAQKKDLLAKRIIASYVHTLNLQEGNQKIPFSVDAARKEAERLQKTWAFKHLASTEEGRNEALTKDRTDLAEIAEGIRRPFKGFTFNERKAKIEMLKEMAEQHMMGPEGRSTKYRNMYNSIMRAYENRNNLVDNDNPAENGENELQNIFDNTEKYMKGKKSLRSKADEQCRFDQAADVIAAVTKGSRGAELMGKGLFDRVNTVRSGKGQKQISYDEFGEENSFGAHSNTRRLQTLAERRLQEAMKRQAGKQKKQEPKQEKKPSEPEIKEEKKPVSVAAKFSEISAYSKKGEDSYREVEPYTGDPEKFERRPMNYHNTAQWEMFSLSDFDKVTPLLKEMVAASLACKDTKMYYNPDRKELGVNEDEYVANYEKYMKDPAVDKLADKLKKSGDRRNLFDGKVNFGNLNFDRLQNAYDGAKKELEAAPVL